MRTKKVEERLKGILTSLAKLEQRVQILEQNQEIQISRPMTKKELSNWNPNLNYQLLNHTDTHLLKDIVELLLDRLKLELKKVPEKTQLQTKKGKANEKRNKA